MTAELISELEAKALPFGSGWSQYTGARSIKVFPLENIEEKIAITYTTVQNSSVEDDIGRKGVLYCTCIIASPDLARFLIQEYDDFGYSLLFEKPEENIEEIAKKVENVDKTDLWSIRFDPAKIAKTNRVFNAVYTKNPRKFVGHSNPEFDLNVAYESNHQWQEVELAIKYLSLLLTSRESIVGFSFTTLALSSFEPSMIAAIPSESKKVKVSGLQDGEEDTNFATDSYKLEEKNYENIIQLDTANSLRFRLYLSERSYVLRVTLNDENIGEFSARFEKINFPFLGDRKVPILGHPTDIVLKGKPGWYLNHRLLLREASTAVEIFVDNRLYDTIVMKHFDRWKVVETKD
jgi:hypothetical protein